MRYVEKYCRAVKSADDNMAHAHCMLDTWGYKYTHRLCNNYCFSQQQLFEERASLLAILHCLCCFITKTTLPLTHTQDRANFFAPFSMLSWMRIKILLEIFRLSLSMLMTKVCTREARFMPGMRFSKRCGCGFKRRGSDVISFSERFGTPRRNVMPSSSESSDLGHRNTQPTTWHHHIPQHARWHVL